MASWASKRRLLYIALIAGVFIVLVAYPLYSFLNKPPSCSDGILNQDEAGVDCGGSCEFLCAFEAVNPTILWSQSLEVESGLYDAVASIENPNVSAGIRSIKYSFKLYDDNGILIAERLGSTFINPQERLTVFEGGIETGRRIPVRTFFEFLTAPHWVEIGLKHPTLLIQNQVFSDDGVRPRLRAEIVNNSLDAVDRIIITALIFDEQSNVIAASKTEVDRLLPQSSKAISFIWPQQLVDEPTRIEIMPRVNIIAR